MSAIVLRVGNELPNGPLIAHRNGHFRPLFVDDQLAHYLQLPSHAKKVKGSMMDSVSTQVVRRIEPPHSSAISEEELIVDPRGAMTPAQFIECRLLATLGQNPLPASHIQGREIRRR